MINYPNLNLIKVGSRSTIFPNLEDVSPIIESSRGIENEIVCTGVVNSRWIFLLSKTSEDVYIARKVPPSPDIKKR
jgi:hypothetical protein